MDCPVAFEGFDLPEWSRREVAVKEAVEQVRQAPGLLIPAKKDWKTQEVICPARYTTVPGEAARAIPFAAVVDPSGCSHPSVASWIAGGRTQPTEALQAQIVHVLTALTAS